MEHDYDVIVIGGGHAGTEAACAAARTGAETLLVTHKKSTIGEMSCNPAIGGLGKGHLVREIDALDGIMGRAADRAGIQFRLLNRSKGPAVRGPRTQADRALYRAAIQNLVDATPGLTVLEAAAEDLIVQNGQCVGVVTGDGKALRAASVVLTTGTFLRGMIHRGEERIPAGRVGDEPAIGIAKRLEDCQLPLGRLKTGTPARLDGDTIEWAKLEMQAADDDPVPFSFLTDSITTRQIDCGITHTNAETHRIIADNLQHSAVYGGHVSGKGPRYCPSIEDKIVRFGDRSGHQIFLEPEGLDDTTVYPNGISTSLPAEIQDAFLRTIVGLENVQVKQYGYAIEYDYVDPRALSHQLQVRALPGLYLAGQINGTTGYEEAGAQGLLAGLNAARAARGLSPVSVGRDEGYIGVMIDDLVTRGVSEPYRMFTSRAEYRLSLRIDNADIRLTPRGAEWGCVSEDRLEAFHVKQAELATVRAALTDRQLSPKDATELGLPGAKDGKRRTLFTFFGLPGTGEAEIDRLCPAYREASRGVRATLEAEALYDGYLERQNADIATLRREEETIIPATVDLSAVPGLSNELKSRLAEAKPETLGQAGRLEGMTPAALAAILIYLKSTKAASVA